MSYTYTTLKTAIQDYTDNTESSFVTNLPNFIKAAEDRIFEAVDLEYFRKNVTSAMTSSDQFLSIPSDLLAVFSLQITTSGSESFLLQKDVNYLRSNGLALGGSLDNAVVVGKNSILNKEGLRFEDEFVRHKVLDSIGDLYLAGSPIQGYFFGNKSGHYLNNQLLRKLFSDKLNFDIV